MAGVFGWWFSVQGVSLATIGEGWSTALTANQPGTGLTWDLVFSGLIVTVLAVARGRELGTTRVAAVIGLTWTLGVCVGLGAWVWWLPRADRES